MEQTLAIETIVGTDLFCGAGGTSTGFIQALKKLGLQWELWAINHWDIAISTHKLNHPQVHHKNSDLERVDPLEVVPSGKLHYLWASPECTYYSNALGGKPINNQSRATPKWVLKWLSRLDIEMFSLENVPEFRDWGPLMRVKMNVTKKYKFPVPAYKDWYKKVKRYGGVEDEWKIIYAQQKAMDQSKRTEKITYNLTCWRPRPERKGEYFQRFINKLKKLGYHVEYRVLCAADYGAPTTRRRLFILGSKTGKVYWPEPTHSKNTARDMLPGFGLKPWKSAKEHVIDWSIPGESIFTKKLSPNTMKRIMAGLKKFNGIEFMMGNQSGAQPVPVHRSVPTITGSGSISLYEPKLKPFLYQMDQGGSLRDVERPIGALTTAEATALAEPLLISLKGTSEGHLENTAIPASNPAPAVTGGGGHLGVAEPFIIPYYSENDGQQVRVHDIHEPMPTVVTGNSHALVEPLLISQENTGGNDKLKMRRATDPVYTITGNPGIGIVEADLKPYIVEYHGNGNAHGVDETFPTVAGNDGYGLALPIVKYQGQKYYLDVLYRMFVEHEYAAAQGFPKGYKFKGTKKQKQKQIGNAVPPVFAKAITVAMLKGHGYAN